MNTPSIAQQIAGLEDMPTPDLWKMWDQYYPRRPEGTNREYMISRIAYKLQEQAIGGLAASTAKRLAAIGSKYSRIKARNAREEIVLAPGTVLIREYDEQEHKVTVTAEGLYEHAGIKYKSLSAIARFISGTPWSGPVFFGLKKSGSRK